MSLLSSEKAYIAGFLDGDGSIHVRLKPNATYRYKFQIAPNVVFYQANKERAFLKQLQELLGYGYIRERNDGITEYIIGDTASIRSLLKDIMPYLRLKRRQAMLMLDILDGREAISTGKDFLRIAEKIDQFQLLNYSKKRTRNALEVRSVLKDEMLLTP